MAEQAENQQNNQDASQNLAVPSSGSDDLTKNDLDQVVGGITKKIDISSPILF